MAESFTGCFAFAVGRKPSPAGADKDFSVWGTATTERSELARVNAVLACNARGGDCRVEQSFCAFD